MDIAYLVDEAAHYGELAKYVMHGGYSDSVYANTSIMDALAFEYARDAAHYARLLLAYEVK